MHSTELPADREKWFSALGNFLGPCSSAWVNANITAEESICAEVIWHYVQGVSADIFVNEHEFINAKNNARTKFYRCKAEANTAEAFCVASLEEFYDGYKMFYNENSDTIPELP